MRGRLLEGVVGAVVLGLAGCGGEPGMGQAGEDLTTRRPISDFLNAQGTWCRPDGNGECALVAGPVPDYIVWSDPASNTCASVDYAGVANLWLMRQSAREQTYGTTVEGTVTEQRRPDGRAEVTVALQTHHALTLVVRGCDLEAGRRPLDTLLTRQPGSVGESTLTLRFVNTASGAPLPDLAQLLAAPAAGQQFLSIELRVLANGPLHGAFGVPEGMPGQVTVTHTATPMSVPGGAPVMIQAERIVVRVAGS
jgi:hypothetical protein